MQDESPFPDPLVRLVRDGYQLRWGGIHGWPHWLRVRQRRGLSLARRHVQKPKGTAPLPAYGQALAVGAEGDGPSWQMPQVLATATGGNVPDL